AALVRFLPMLRTAAARAAARARAATDKLARVRASLEHADELAAAALAEATGRLTEAEGAVRRLSLECGAIPLPPGVALLPALVELRQRDAREQRRLALQKARIDAAERLHRAEAKFAALADPAEMIPTPGLSGFDPDLARLQAARAAAQQVVDDARAEFDRAVADEQSEQREAGA
ncbi:MAG TPA: hypothetical protein VM487_14440, partial [Phycisphaerae bacterium]|nr:hypothetical protein [Phycisphaerae bacterium]